MLSGQEAPKTPAFEVASIKPSDPNERGTSVHTSPGRYTATGITTKNLIMNAYNIKRYQLEGAPGWTGTERYDITAKLEDSGEKLPRPSERARQIRTALQKLLAERFQLAIRRETRTLPAYALTVAKGGFKLKTEPYDEDKGSSMSMGPGKLTAKRTTMDGLANILAGNLDRPVADMTGIQGACDFSLTWTPDDAVRTEKPTGAGEGPAAATDMAAGPSIFTALQEQLGLKLEPRKAPVEIIVVERIEKPVEN